MSAQLLPDAPAALKPIAWALQQDIVTGAQRFVCYPSPLPDVRMVRLFTEMQLDDAMKNLREQRDRLKAELRQLRGGL